MLRRNFNPMGTLIAVIIILIIAAITLTPVANPIKSMEETDEILVELGYTWHGKSVPVIVFGSPHCPASKSFVSTLDSRGVDYLLVNVATNETGRSIHAELGRNYFGTVATRATPTTVVGTEVIRGSNFEAVLEAIEIQNQLQSD